MPIFGVRSADSSAEAKRRKRRLGLALSLGVIGFLVVFVLFPYVEFGALFWLLQSRLIAFAIPWQIVVAIALPLLPPLIWSFRTALRALRRRQRARLFFALLFPASLFAGAFVLAQPPSGQLFNPVTGKPYFRYLKSKEGKVTLRARWWRVDPVTGEQLQDLTPAAAAAWQQQGGRPTSNIRTDVIQWFSDLTMHLRRHNEQSPQSTERPANPNPPAAREDLTFRLDSCTMTGSIVGCEFTVLNASADDKWVILMVGDSDFRGRSQMFDDRGREYVAHEVQLGGRIRRFGQSRDDSVPVVPNVPTKAAVRFESVAPDAQSITVLRIAFYRGGNAERVEFRNVPVRRTPPDEPVIASVEHAVKRPEQVLSPEASGPRRREASEDEPCRGVQVDQSVGEFPVETLFAVQGDPCGGAQGIGAGVGKNPIGQTIRSTDVASGAVTGIEISLARVGRPTDDVAVSLRRDLFGPDLAKVAVSPEILPTHPRFATLWLSFNQPFPTEQVRYLVVQRTGQLDSSNFAVLRHADPRPQPNAYPSGSYFECANHDCQCFCPLDSVGEPAYDVVFSLLGSRQQRSR